MLRSRSLSLVLGVTLLGGCAFEPEGVEVQLSDDSILEYPAELVDFENDRGDALQGVLIVPDDVEAPRPAVIVLHGNGGLFTKPDRNDVDLEVAPQFADWAAMLTRRGHAVLLPSSYYSRGYWEWSRRPLGTSDVDGLVMRTHDVYGARRFACEQEAIDCDRMGLVGFSNGGSITLLSLHDRVDELPGMHTLPPPDERGGFDRAYAYYPGCGLDQLPDDSGHVYYPITDLHVFHGSKDPIVEHCPSRVDEAHTEAQARQEGDGPMSLVVYDDVGHGFDGDPRGDAEVQARDISRDEALAGLDAALSP